MNAEGATPISLGFGVERHIEKWRSASHAHEKVEHLTCAVEALLMHLKFLDGDARVAREATTRLSLDVELERTSPVPPDPGSANMS
jgi:ATP/maltotriose-dependent transcriptional regulator MalT